MMTTIRTARLLTLAAIVMALTACSFGRADLEQWVAQQKAREGAPLPPMPVVKTFETFVYQDQDLRDPFVPPARNLATTGLQAQQGPSPDPNRVREPLESFALDSLKMVGTIGGGEGIQALVMDPQGTVHTVHEGNYAGKNYGHIISITQDEIELVELVPNGSGGWRERDAKIALGGDNP